MSDNQKTKSPCPWRVCTGVLRPQFPTKIIEIRDANNAVVIPWVGFNGDAGQELSHTRRLAVARQIVKAVNNAS